jgi:hypothetical protein
MSFTQLLTRVVYDSSGHQKKKSITMITTINMLNATPACTNCPEETYVPSKLPRP